MRLVCLFAAAALCAGLSAKEEGSKENKKERKTAMKLTSPAFKANGFIPKKHTCQGEDVSPPLTWSGAPKDAKSFALIMDDPDAPPGVWVHWVLYDLPPGAAALAEGLAKEEALKDGSKHGLCWGVEEFSNVGYYGPCPPPGKPHHYSFRLYALDKKLGLSAKAAKPELLKAMQGHILAQAELKGLFKR
ncbi:MAG: YbhB/YbcL family Raf kinase inhibitor-like protein [Elusimicrobia bacterium]|nr:YbhB/YbcL family Raf kinase inhibitor-like protein [Elusimicrobiota bacterium]